jgi:Transposase, Mutator family
MVRIQSPSRRRVYEPSVPTLTFYRLPRQHYKHLKSINMLERLNEEIKRRTHVVNPLAQVPTLLLPHGQVLTESAAITLHLADANHRHYACPRRAISSASDTQELS